MNKHTGIVCSDPAALKSRILVSGLHTLDDRPDYEPGAIVPDLSTLRGPTQHELESLIAGPLIKASNAIEVITFTPELEDYLADQHAVRTEPTECQPGELTTTRNTQNNNLKVGLHIDNLTTRSPEHRSPNQRRMALNGGPGFRWLLIGSIDATDLGVLLGCPPGTTPGMGSVREYARNPQVYGGEALRCTWLLLMPDEGYIAPTEEFILHDGSTIDPHYPTGRGHDSLGSTAYFWLTAPDGIGQFGSAI